MDTNFCNKCILDSKTPGIILDPETGLCQFCNSFRPLPNEKRMEFLSIMDSFLKNPQNSGKFDVIVALSGGIDSSYALVHLREKFQHLNILAVQFDNGYLSDTALRNARHFCTLTNSTYYRLALDQKAMNHAFSLAANSRNAYSESAKRRASDICNTCISIIKQKVIELAITTHTPFIIFSFSPGQADVPFITLTKPFLEWMRNLFDISLEKMGENNRDIYLFNETLLKDSSPEPGVTIIHPYLIWDYDKPVFKKRCKDLGWIEPDLMDSNSSNCLLNSYAIQNHLEKYHIHPYAYDLASLVRNGNMKREDALNDLQGILPEASIERVKHKLSER